MGGFIPNATVSPGNDAQYIASGRAGRRTAHGIYFSDGCCGGDTGQGRVRKLVEAKAVLIGREIKTGMFDYLKWFPEGNRAEKLKPKTTAPKTIGEYYRVLNQRKKPPVVRPGLERDYKDHFKRYILPKFEDVTFTELTPPCSRRFARICSKSVAWL